MRHLAVFESKYNKAMFKVASQPCSQSDVDAVFTSSEVYTAKH